MSEPNSVVAFNRGTVWLVGAGPGDPGPLILHALDALKRADVIVYDAPVSDRVLALASPGGEGARYRGHEFHYATIVEQGGDEPFAEVADAHGSPTTPAGGRRGFASGSFFHLIAPVE